MDFICSNSMNRDGVSTGSNICYKKDSEFITHNDQILNPMKFIHKVCSWHYDWLQTYDVACKQVRKAGAIRPPPVADHELKMLSLVSYDSFEQYANAFTTMMHYDLWEEVYIKWEKENVTRQWFSCQFNGNCQPHPYGHGNSCIKLYHSTFKMIVSKQSFLHAPRTGSLIVIRSTLFDKHYCMLGYVYNVKKNTKISKEMTDTSEDGEIFLQLTVLTHKNIYDKLVPQQVLSISNVAFIRNSINSYEALCKLPKSPLFHTILRPNIETFLPFKNCNNYLVPEMPVNERQLRAIATIGELCVVNPSQPKISLIHGPPGTGKTRTIVSLICQILRLSKRLGEKCRILVCAPTNAAVDETTRRLVDLNSININLKVVRVGVKESSHPSVQPYSLDNLIDMNIKQKHKISVQESFMKELNRRRSVIDNTVVQLKEARAKNMCVENIKSIEQRLVELVRSKVEFENNEHDNCSIKKGSGEHYEMMDSILLNAEVITSTVDFCCSNVMKQTFSGIDRPFTCCIVDEAAQCKEIETWLPLMMGVNKYVLVGDHKQLPACIFSSAAQHMNYNVSLFERFFNYFVNLQNRRYIVHSLNIQYRMHPEIVHWPSKQFYDSLLVSDNHVADNAALGIKPYIVFNISDSQEQELDTGKLYNDTEATLALTLVQALQGCTDGGLSIGIITPYNQQRCNLDQLISPYTDQMNITVNTVDSLQGQEKDIVILSFVRANASAKLGFLTQRQRLNVALTRAKKSCFLIGHLPSLSSNTVWRSLIHDAQTRNVVIDLTTKQVDDVHLIYTHIKTDN